MHLVNGIVAAPRQQMIATQNPGVLVASVLTTQDRGCQT